MCVYCMVADHTFKYDRPWWPSTNPQHPLIPKPVTWPAKEWDLERLKEYRDLLQQIHELEEKVGCPCEPNKADYLELFRQRIEALEKKVEKSNNISDNKRGSDQPFEGR